MKCSRCQHENPSGVKFCGECGVRLESACVACGAANPPGNKFCGQCGASLQAQSPTKFASPETYTPKHLAEKILTSKSALEGERKQVTVLFADMKGSMELLADRDPEEARKLLDPVIEHMMEAVHRYEGTVSNLMGDGIMALFGAPLAHEDHAVRACYAALRMQESVKRYAEGVRLTEGIAIQIRVGLNSGEVVVGSIGNDLKMDYTAIGQTVHLASRMEQMATSGSILLAPDVLRLAEGYVQVKSLGPATVKGLSEPVEVCEITGAGAVRTRLQAAAARGLTRFIGRDAEMERLRQTLEQARGGRGQLVAIVGEPGVGKSRLFYEFTHSHRVTDWLIIESGSVSYGKATPYLPLIDLLKAYFKIHDRDNQREIREKVTGKLLTLDKSLEPLLPAFLSLLNVTVEDEQWQMLDPSQRRQRTLDAVKRLLLRESQVQPLLLVLEDLHWIDSETQSFLDTLIESLPTARLLLLVNYRPEYQHGWGSKTYYNQLRIDPLTPESASELLNTLLGEDAKLQPLKQLLVKRTEGNPFFLEESIRTLLEAKALVGERGNYCLVQAIERIQLPATVQAVLAARIDRLSPEEKRLLQSAAVIGKDVPFALLETIADQSQEELRRCLSGLQGGEFLYETRLFPDVEYTFKHALTHEVAYGSVLQERRRLAHARIAQAVERLYPERLTEHVELLAYHAFRGELWERAVEYLHQAGSKAAARCTYKEAASYFQQALEVLGRLPETRDAIAQAIDIRIALGAVLMAAKGSYARDVEEIYTVARELCERIGETAQLFPVTWGLCRFYDAGGELRKAKDLGDQLVILAERSQDTSLILEAHHTLWATLILCGEFSSTLSHAEKGTGLYDPNKHAQHAFQYGGHDPGVCALVSEARALWLLGFPDKALQKAQESLALARKLSHPFSLVFTTFAGIAWVHEHRGDVQITQQLLDGVSTIATDQDRPSWQFRTILLRALLLTEQGRSTEAFELTRQAVALYPSRKSREQSHTDALLAQVYGKTGEVDKAFDVLERALARAHAAGERWYEAELHRIKGELLLTHTAADHQQAETCFQNALNVARDQSAKSLELRATMSLGRLWQRQGKKDEARQLLAEIYGWFAEGFDSADLKAAKALLEQLLMKETFN
jgi:class 3 adenylate cyclase/predicted ATPase